MLGRLTGKPLGLFDCIWVVIGTVGGAALVRVARDAIRDKKYRILALVTHLVVIGSLGYRILKSGLYYRYIVVFAVGAIIGYIMCAVLLFMIFPSRKDSEAEPSFRKE